MNAMLLIESLQQTALRHADGRAIVHGGERRNWQQTTQRIAALAGALRERGLAPGTHVATLALNAPAYFELLLAVWWAGGVLVPLNTRLAYEEMRFIIAHAQAGMLVTDADFEAHGKRALAEIPGLRSLTVLGAGPHDALFDAAPIEAARPRPEALAGIFYTGGTTGLPKGVELTHANFAGAAANMRRDLAHGPGTVYLHAAPLFHLADFGIGLGVTLAGGGHSFMARFTTEGFYQRLREDGVTHLQLVPTMLAAVLDAPCRDDALLARIERIAYGAAPIPAPLLERTLAAFPQARIHQFYGMTENCGACVMLPPERHVLRGPRAGKLGAAGRATEGFAVRIADDQGTVLPPGQVGEIQIRGIGVMRGYWHDLQQTGKTLVDGWLHSGDGGYLDADGYLYVVDRIKDMIISGGENIYGAEVESALASHPSVQACAVVGLPDDHWGERVHAVIVPQPGARLDPEALDRHCRARLAGYKVPRSYAAAEALPLSGVGKVQKKVLREQCLAHLKEQP